MNEFTKITMPLEQEGAKSVVRAWLKQIGQSVARDEPLVEIETDKVAVEVSAPAAGVLAEIAIEPGQEALPGATLGVLRTGAENISVIPDAQSAIRDPGDRRALHLPLGSGFSAIAEPRNDGNTPASDRRYERRLSPLVKRLLSEHKLSSEAITGAGANGRITQRDVEAFIARKSGPPAPSPASAASAGEGAGGPYKSHRVAHDPMRKSIAEHMTRSLQAAPHVTAVFEADFSAIMAHRARHSQASEQAGAVLTYSAYVVRACAEAMAAAPHVNSRWHEDYLEVFEDVNVGVGVSLGDKGLIAPVIMCAQSLSLLETAKRLNDLTQRARAGRLAPADVQGGTFTFSNHGVSGSLLASPIIINQPQAAILGVGKLEKRAIVRDADGADAVLIRPMAYVSLTIDHRVLDGHQTNAWLTRFVETLEAWPLEGAYP